MRHPCDGSTIEQAPRFYFEGSVTANLLAVALHVSCAPVVMLMCSWFVSLAKLVLLGWVLSLQNSRIPNPKLRIQEKQSRFGKAENKTLSSQTAATINVCHPHGAALIH